MIGNSLHQQEYKFLRKGLDAGLSKHQISNLFNSQGALHTANIPPLTAIEEFSDARNGKIRADCYDDCQYLPDPSALDPTQKNHILLTFFQAKWAVCEIVQCIHQIKHFLFLFY